MREVSPPAPAVSVILPSYYSQETIGACLRALSTQTFRDFEAIVVDSTPDPEPAARLAADHPWVRVRHSAQRLLPHEARNLGAAMSRGEILAFTDPDCTARPDWLERLVAAQRQGHEAAGGAVDCLGGWRSRAVHIAKYSLWLPGGAARPHTDLPTANVSYSRRLWERAGCFEGRLFAGDTEYSKRVQRLGLELWFEPRAVVTHHDRSPAAQLFAERFRRGRDFGLMRVQMLGWPRRRCLLYLGLFPVLPWVMTWRAARHVWQSGNVSRYLAVLPVGLAANTAWCLGEAVSHWRCFTKTLRERRPAPEEEAARR